MARGSREDVQNIALYHMDKINRNRKHDDRNTTLPTLEEQLKEAARKDALSPKEKLQEMSHGDWLRALSGYLVGNKRAIVTTRTMEWIFAAKAKELQKFHDNGTLFGEIVLWIQDVESEYINR